MVKETETRVLEIVTAQETLRITIPATWRVTFGPIIQGDRARELALRIYETKEQQRACFVDVKTFRDLSLPLQRLIRTKSGKESWVRDSLGNEEAESKSKVTEEWRA